MKFSRDKKFLFILLIVFHFFLFTGLYLEGLEPVTSDKRKPPKIVEIQKGENILSIANKFKREGLIKNRVVFIIEALRTGIYKEFKAGEYALYPFQNLREIFEILKQGKVYLHKVTIFEGATLWQISKILEENHICSGEEFLKLAQDKSFIESLGFSGPSLEGFLYPETYYFEKNTPPAKVIKTMVSKFLEVWKELEPHTINTSLTMREIVILASIVEKEAFFEAENQLLLQYI